MVIRVEFQDLLAYCDRDNDFAGVDCDFHCAFEACDRPGMLPPSRVNFCAPLTPNGVARIALFERTVTSKCPFEVTIA